MSGGGKELLKSLLGCLVAEYRINYIYAADAPPAAESEDSCVKPESLAHRTLLAVSPTFKMRNSLSYAEAGLAGLVLVEAAGPLCVAHFAEADQYDRNSTWPLKPGEVALMDIATEEEARGRGLAVRMIRAATRSYLAQGRSRLIAFIWWSNTPSLRAFEKAGWKRIGCSVELRFGSRWHALRIPLS